MRFFYFEDYANPKVSFTAHYRTIRNVLLLFIYCRVSAFQLKDESKKMHPLNFLKAIFKDCRVGYCGEFRRFQKNTGTNDERILPFSMTI